jgi:class 3 adenylate cyclase
VTTLRTTAIMKTDVSGSTPRFRALGEADLHALLIEHRELLIRHAAPHDGRIVKPEGDGFWLVFPSVTAAALAAMRMQEELRFSQPNRGDDRLAMRIVITLGDVLHEEGALVGDAVVMAARIEAITPPDEIYLSASAWLAVNHGEIRTGLVDILSLKGFDGAVPVYRVEQTHRTRLIANEHILVTDLRGFRRVVEAAPMTTVEQVLEGLYALTKRVAGECGGAVRFSSADSYFLTFPDAVLAMTAAERLSQSWDAFVRAEQLPCEINVAVHQGLFYAFRSFLYGPGIDVAAGVEDASQDTMAPNEGGIFVTGEMRTALTGTVWETRLIPTDVRLRRRADIEVFRLAPREASGTQSDRART